MSRSLRSGLLDIDISAMRPAPALLFAAFHLGSGPSFGVFLIFAQGATRDAGISLPSNL